MHSQFAVVLLVFALRCARGTRICVRAFKGCQTLGEAAIPVVDHIICTLGWSYCSTRKMYLLLGGSSRGILLVWGIIPEDSAFSRMRAEPPTSPHLPVMSSIWSFRPQGPSRGGVGIVAETSRGIQAVVTAELSPGGNVQASSWRALESPVSVEMIVTLLFVDRHCFRLRRVHLCHVQITTKFHEFTFRMLSLFSGTECSSI